ncbi:MAG: hypothetical protein ABI435_04785 [Pseudolysinimonas sp.]
MTLNVHRYDGLIIPDQIPGDDLNPNSLDDVAHTLRTAGTDALQHADAASIIWAGMPTVLESPEGAVIYGALGSPDRELRTLSGKFDRVATALEDFASLVRPLIKTFTAIKNEAIKLTDEIGYDGLVWVSPNETKAYEWDSKVSVYAGRGGQRTAAEVVDYLRSLGESAYAHGNHVLMLAPWTQSSEHIDRNNALMDQVADAYAKLQNAEADCANAINRERDLCVADVVKIEAWQLKQSGDDTAVLPWGHRVDEDRNCGESVWWGVGNAGKEMLEGVAAFAGYSAVTGQFSLETAMNARIGLLEAVGSLALIVVFPPSIQLGQLGVPVFKEATDLTGGMLKGLVAWDVWAKNPAEAFGRVVVNVGTFFIPGVGEIGGAIKGITTAGHAAEVTADAARLTEVVEVGGSRVDGLITKLDGAATEGVGAGVKVDEFVGVGSHVELPDGRLLHVEAPHIDAPPVEGPHVDAPTTPHPDHGGDAPSTHSGGDAPSTHSGGDTPSKHGGDDAPSGHSGGDTTTAPHPDTDTPGGAGHGEGAIDTPSSAHGNDGPSPAADEAGSGGPGDGAGTPAPSPRVYEMMDGHEHASTWAPEQLGSSRVTDAILDQNRVSRPEFIDILNKPLNTLDARDFTVLRGVLDDLPPFTPDTVFQKVMDQPWIDSSGRIHLGVGDDMVMNNTLDVAGSVTVAGDSAHLGTPQALHDGLRLDYHETHFTPGDSSSFVMRFQVDDPAAITPSLHSRFGGDGSQDAWRAPFTGNGFLGAAHDIIPEYIAGAKTTIGDGTEMWEILPDGTQRLFAVLRGTEWIPQG